MHAIGHRLRRDRSGNFDALTAMRGKPAGSVRITCGDNVLLPKLAPLLREYPDIKLEFEVNYGFRDIVADRFDAGVWMNSIDKDMVAMPRSARLCAWRGLPRPNTSSSIRSLRRRTLRWAIGASTSACPSQEACTSGLRTAETEGQRSG
jgi:hypothetical protein